MEKRSCWKSTMRWSAMALAGVLAAGPSWAKPLPATLYVDCAAPPGGDGSRQAPLPTITAALPVARALSSAHRVTVDVAAGTCAAETLPILLDFPIHVRGAREPVLDVLGLPTGEGERDTVITWSPPSSGPPASFRPIFFEISTSAGAEVSHLSIDGLRPPGGNTRAVNNPGPTGIRGRLGSAFDVKSVRLVRMEVGIKSQGATGRVRESYLGDVGAPFQLHGGLPDATNPTGPSMVVRHNRIEAFRYYGMAVSGGGFEGGTHLDLVVEDNDFRTPYDRTGPSNPAGLRISPAVLEARNGLVHGRFARNSIRGPVRYPVIIHAGMPQRLDGATAPSGELYLSFEDTFLDEAGEGESLVTFTNARATELPCEFNPPTIPPCSGSPGAGWWAYLGGATFDIRHSGELDGLRIDHPEFDPLDGTELGNRLLVNDEVMPYQTFVVVP